MRSRLDDKDRLSAADIFFLNPESTHKKAPVPGIKRQRGDVVASGSSIFLAHYFNGASARGTSGRSRDSSRSSS